MSPYLLPDGLDVGEALKLHLDVRAEPARTADYTFYDTFDGRLHAAGVVLRHGDGRLSLLDRANGSERAHALADAAPEKLFAADLAPALDQQLAPVIEMRALTPVARVTTRHRRLAVFNNDEKTVVRLAIEAPRGLRARLYASPVRGYDSELARVRRLLAQLNLTEVGEPLADEAIVAAGADPGGVSSKLDIELHRGESAGGAAERVLARTHAIVEANLPGALADVDSEFVHDLRVANRRARSLLRQLKAEFPPAPLERLRDELRWIQQITGEIRDLDVQLLDFAAYKDRDRLAPLHTVLDAHRARAFAQMRRDLTGARMRKALQAWADLRALPETPPVESAAGERIAKVFRRMVRMGEAIDDSSHAEALHELRKLGKELRYLLEFFGALFDPDVVKPMIKALKALQDVLGRHQDFEVQADTLRALTPEVAKQPGGADALLALGVLIDGLSGDQARARAEFAAQFADFAAEPRRAAVKATFT